MLAQMTLAPLKDDVRRLRRFRRGCSAERLPLSAEGGGRAAVVNC